MPLMSNPPKDNDIGSQLLMLPIAPVVKFVPFSSHFPNVAGSEASPWQMTWISDGDEHEPRLPFRDQIVLPRMSGWHSVTQIEELQVSTTLIGKHVAAPVVLEKISVSVHGMTRVLVGQQAVGVNVLDPPPLLPLPPLKPLSQQQLYVAAGSPVPCSNGEPTSNRPVS